MANGGIARQTTVYQRGNVAEKRHRKETTAYQGAKSAEKPGHIFGYYFRFWTLFRNKIPAHVFPHFLYIY